jgi:sugar phosphate isomerase/epimerase
VAETFKKVAEIGYSNVQVSGIGGEVDPKDVARIAQDNGLEISCTHIGFNRFLEDIDGVIEQHQLWNCKHPAIGGLGAEYHCAEGVKRFIDELRPVAAKLAEAGMDFSYHNHSHELVKYGDRTWLAMLYEDAPGDVVKAEIDTYWITHGGGDPAAWITKCAGRQPLMHLKDMCITEQREQRFAEIGEGNLNWSAIMAAAEQSGVEYALVEQDRTYDRDPFESLAISYRNLKAMGWE